MNTTKEASPRSYSDFKTVNVLCWHEYIPVLFSFSFCFAHSASEPWKSVLEKMLHHRIE